MESQENMQIKSITSTDGWSDKQVQTLSYGGNSRLDEFLGPYLVSLQKDKYSTNVFNLKATEFYSKRLNAFANLGYFSEPPPSLEEGVKTIENVNLLNLDYPHPDGEDNENSGFNANGKPMKLEDEDDDFFDKLDSGLKEFWETTGDIFQSNSSKVWESTAGIREKTKDVFEKGGEATKEALDKAGDFTKESWFKTKFVTQEAWSNVVSKTTELIHKIGPEHNEEGLSFKKFFGWLQPEEKKEEQPVNDPVEQQYFVFQSKQEGGEESHNANGESSQQQRKSSDDEDQPIGGSDEQSNLV